MVTNWPHPRCLVESTQDDGLKINEETWALLAEVLEPVMVVGIAGRYRTGKSYLLNRIAGIHGFELGSTVQSKTKGIWVWVRAHPHRPDCCLLLLDTEGLEDAEKGSPQHDTMLFVLTVLLSSSITYNSLNVIDHDSITKLHLVSELADHIKVKKDTEEEDGTQFARMFPIFIWAMRDFHLDTVLDGRPISSDGYLEHILELKKGVGSRVSNYNVPRECIRTCFPSRKCFIFPRPVNDRNMLKALEKTDPKDLDKAFVQVSDEYVEYILGNTPPKRVDGRLINGKILCNLASCYITAMQNEEIPCIETAIQSTAKIENNNAKVKSVDCYRQKMMRLLDLPTDISTISEVHQSCEKDAIAVFLDLAFFDNDNSYQEQMIVEIKNEYEVFCAQNEEKSQKISTDILEKLYESVAIKVRDGHYMQPGGYNMYKTDMEMVETMYGLSPGKGVKEQAVLAQFLQAKEIEAQGILAADEILDSEQKNIEAKQQKAESDRRKAKAANEEASRLKKIIADREASYKENMRQLEKKAEETNKAMKAEIEELLQSKQTEQQKLLEQGFKERAKQMQQEIDSLMSSPPSGLFRGLGNALQAGADAVYYSAGDAVKGIAYVLRNVTIAEPTGNQ